MLRSTLRLLTFVEVPKRSYIIDITHLVIQAGSFKVLIRQNPSYLVCLVGLQAGMDSLGAVELRNALATKFAISMPATVAFDFPTPEALAGFVQKSLAPYEEAPGQVTPKSMVRVLDACATLL